MNRWHLVNTAELITADARQERERGVRTELSLSPYDVPEAIRAYLDDKMRRLVVEFKYIQDEPWELRTTSDHTAFRIGKRSQRLYGVEVDMGSKSIDDVALAFDCAKAAINTLGRDASAHRAPRVPPDNLRTLQTIVSRSNTVLKRELQEAV